MTVKHLGQVSLAGELSAITSNSRHEEQITCCGIWVPFCPALSQISAAHDDYDSDWQQTRDAQTQEQAGDEAFPFELETEPESQAAEESEDQGDDEPDGIGG